MKYYNVNKKRRKTFFEKLGSSPDSSVYINKGGSESSGKFPGLKQLELFTENPKDLSLCYPLIRDGLLVVT